MFIDTKIATTTVSMFLTQRARLMPGVVWYCDVNNVRSKDAHKQWARMSLIRPKLTFLSPDMKMHILLTVLHTFHIELVGRICRKIKTSHPW